MQLTLQDLFSISILLRVSIIISNICTGRLDTSCTTTFQSSENRTFIEKVNSSNFANKSFCNYFIQVDQGKQVNLSFTGVQLETYDSSFTDYVVIFDGADCMSQRIGVVYDQHTSNFTSSGNQMTALLMVNNHVYPVGFHAKYDEGPTKPSPPSSNRILENCGRNLTGASGRLSFNGSEVPNVLCIWKITVKAKKVVFLEIEKLTLESSFSSFRVLDGSTCAAREIYRMWGYEDFEPTSVLSSSNIMTVVFASPPGIVREKVMASYKSVEPNFTTTTTTTTVPPTTERARSTPGLASTCVFNMFTLVGWSLFCSVQRLLSSVQTT
ncbi:unnamed protein product [Dicrocoelium dendriticum]|nr:unnamed protein product [Dicrocoelium dendriticum]